MGSQAHLAGFRGLLQDDTGYDGLYRNGVTEVACWAHSRQGVGVSTSPDHDRTALDVSSVPFSLTIVLGPGLMLFSTGTLSFDSLEYTCRAEMARRTA